MRIHLVTVGRPKLSYAKAGWEEYLGRLKHYHTLRITHVPDKSAYDAAFLQQTIGNAYSISLVINGTQYTSHELAALLEKRSFDSRELCFIIGGPEGLPQAIIEASDLRLGLSKLTFPHDLAMVILAEALYRASTIRAGQPYHK